MAEKRAGLEIGVDRGLGLVEANREVAELEVKGGILGLESSQALVAPQGAGEVSFANIL